jgi:hypothetical protein
MLSRGTGKVEQVLASVVAISTRSTQSTPEKAPRHDEIIAEHDQDDVDRERDHNVDRQKQLSIK